MTINRKEIGQKIIKMVTYSWKDMERFTDSARTILVVRLVPSCAGRLMTARGNAAPRFLVTHYLELRKKLLHVRATAGAEALLRSEIPFKFDGENV